MVSVAFFFVYFVVKKSQLQKINFPQLSNFNPASTKKSIFAFQKKVDLMSRILAIDYGGKRVGLAVTDTLQMIANGLDTISTAEVFTFLKNYLAKENVVCIVVGEPKRLNNTATHSTEMTEKFVQELKKKFPAIAVERMDERFTSKMAFQAMIDGGLKKKDRQNKETVDKVSATLILQSYLQQVNFTKHNTH